MAVETLTREKGASPPSAKLFAPSCLRNLALLDKFERQEYAGKELEQKLCKSALPVGKLGRHFLEIESTFKPSSGWITFYQPLSAKAARVSPADIQRFLDEFSLLLWIDDAHSKAGFFISGMINGCKDKNIVLSVKNAPGINGLGYWCDKSLTINGDVGSRVAYDSRDGTVIVNGNAGDYPGFLLERGSLTVNGNVGRFLGYQMRCGAIIVNGNAGGKVGEEMWKGSISVSGSIGSIGKIYGKANIFQRGAQLVRDGEIIAQPINK